MGKADSKRTRHSFFSLQMSSSPGDGESSLSLPAVFLTPSASGTAEAGAAGLGTLYDSGFSKVGEPTDRKVRAQLLDRGLEILTGLWSGEPFAYEGEHYRIEEMTFCPGRCRDRASQSGWSARGRAGGP
jgi:hypothetical protein